MSSFSSSDKLNQTGDWWRATITKRSLTCGRYGYGYDVVYEDGDTGTRVYANRLHPIDSRAAQMLLKEIDDADDALKRKREDIESKDDDNSAILSNISNSLSSRGLSHSDARSSSSIDPPAAKKARINVTDLTGTTPTPSVPILKENTMCYKPG